MRHRRVRLTFLLKLVILGASVALFALVFLATTSGSVKLAMLGLLLCVWLLGIEAGLLPMLIEYILVKRASRPGASLPSAWFVDVEAEHQREMEMLREGTRDNPSLH